MFICYFIAMVFFFLTNFFIHQLLVCLCNVKGLGVRLDNPCKGVITVVYIFICPSLCVNFECCKVFSAGL